MLLHCNNDLQLDHSQRKIQLQNIAVMCGYSSGMAKAFETLVGTQDGKNSSLKSMYGENFSYSTVANVKVLK